MHLWDIPSARLRPCFLPPYPRFESSGVIVFSGDSRYLALAGEGTPFARTDRLPAALRDLLHRVRGSGNPETIGRLFVWDLARGRQRLAAQAGGNFIALHFAPDGSRLAAAREPYVDVDERFKMWTKLRDVMLWSLDSSASTSNFH